MANEPLKITHVPFSVSAQIDRAPHWTMVRELTMNAIEAAAKATGERLVHWTTGTYNGVRKAVIFNTGPGMDDKELKAATDLNCRIDKSLGLDENFGVGAKVSSLPNNRHGMRFRSCKAGVVSEVILGYDPDQNLYVRFERTLADGTGVTVLNVTAAATKEGRDLSYDWTEVMLFGNSADQDTAARMVASAPNAEKAYLANALYRRFYRLPDGVRVKIDPVYQRFDTPRTFVPIGQRWDKFNNSETVEVPEWNLKIHFLHDPHIGDKSGLRQSASGALGSTSTTCCLIHKNEMYSVISQNAWAAAAPHFGIPFGSKELCVHIELDDTEARPAQYRERLIAKENGEDIDPMSFALAVRDRMPQWVKDVIRNASPRKSEDMSDLKQELQDLLNRYKVRVKARKIDPENGEPSDKDAGDNAAGGGGGSSESEGTKTKGRARRLHDAPEGAVASSLYEMFEKAPNPIILDDPAEIEARQLKGRAGCYIPNTGDLFVNGLYEAVTRTIDDVEPDYAGQTDPETLRRLVLQAAQKLLAFRVGKAVVFALAKRANDDWGDDNMAVALTPESLSIAADNYEESLNAVKRAVREGIKLDKVAA
jgi:hypothetical protein